MTSSGGVGPVFVGRESELTALEHALAATRRGEPQTMVISGEPGVGKSRLVAELAHRSPDCTFLVGGCVEQGADGLPFAPFTAALRALIRRIGAPAVLELLPRQTPGELARLLPELGPANAVHDELSRPRLFEELLVLLRDLAAGGPVVLAVEDAHWADRSSRELIDFVVRNQSALPSVLMLLTCRSDELHHDHPVRGLLAELGRLPWVERRELARLPRREVARQLRGLIGDEQGPELAEIVYRRSEGNPLYVEALVEAGVLTDPDGLGVPDTLSDLLLAGVRRLPAASRELVAVVAVGGPSVPHALLATVSELAEPALSAALRPAVDTHVLLADGAGYAVRHTLIREAVQADLLPGERAALHTRYAGALRAQPGLAASGSAAAALARHCRAAGRPDEAICAAWQAAADAADALAFAEQLAMLALVLELWADAVEPAARIGADRIAVLERAVGAARSAGADEHGERLATEALAALDPGTEPVRVALLLEQRGRMRQALGRASDLDDLRAAVEAAPPEHPARAMALTALAARLSEVPMPAEAAVAATTALQIAKDTGDERSAASALIIYGMLQARAGELDAGLAHLHDAAAIAERIAAPFIRLYALGRQAHLLEGYGQLERAAERARDGLAAADEVGLGRVFGGKHAIVLVGALTALGHWDSALAEVDRGLDLAPPPTLANHLRCQRAAIVLQRGGVQPADEELGLLRSVPGQEIGFGMDPVAMVRLEAEVRLAQGRPSEALAAAERALGAVDPHAASRFSWPLLVLAATASVASGPAVEPWRALAAAVPVRGPVQAAWAHSFAATCAPDEPAAWHAAVQAWTPLGQPLPLARAMIGAAAASLAADGDRETAAAALRRAAGLATRLGAQPLRAQIEGLARRARIRLDAGATDASDNGVGAARRLGVTDRELQVLRLVAEGRSNREIGAELYISAKTASVHVSHLIAKLGVSNRIEAAAAAHRLGLDIDVTQ